jgi:hypothetical protein
MKKLLFYLTIIAMFSLVSCATIMTAGDQEISIESNPSKATVEIFDSANMMVWNSKTPTTVTLDKSEGFFKKATYRVEITKEGYEKSVVQLKSNINGWYWGNILFGGLLGMLIVDPLTGSMYTLSPEQITTTMQESLGVKVSSTNLSIVLRQDISETDWEKISDNLTLI